MYDESYDRRGYGDDRRHQGGRSRRDDRGYNEYPDERDHHRAPPPEHQDRGRPPPPPRPKGPSKVSYKCIGGMIVAIVALILIFILMSYPWYEMSYSHEITYADESDGPTQELKLTYYLTEVTSEGKYENITFPKITTPYDNESIKEGAKDVKNVMEYTYYFYLISAIFLIISIIVIPIVAIGKAPHVIGLVFLLLALIFILIIPIYFYFSLPPAIETQFDAVEWGEPLNDTFSYNGEFLSSGKGTYYYDANWDDAEDEVAYELEWGPGLGFWLVFVPLITIVVAQAVYSMGKRDVSRAARGPPPRDHRPSPPRGRDHDYDDYGDSPRGRGRDYDSRPPPPQSRSRRRDYDDGYDPQPAPARRGGEGDRRDYGPPRPMGDDDYNYIQKLQSTRGDDRGYDYDSRPPPRPPRRR